MKTLATIFSLFISFNCLAWGAIGHRVVGEIAWKVLDANTKKQVQEILGFETLADVANWADFIKSDPAWSKASPWHYVTIADGQTYKTSKKVPEGDVVWAINHFCEVLGAKSKSTLSSLNEKKEAIKFLAHFIGDIHQPLHVGRGDDRGGNTVEIMWFGQKSNLHRVWDEDLIKLQELSYTEYVSNIFHEARTEILDRKKDGIDIWIQEAMNMRNDVYDIVVNKDAYAKYGEYKYNFKNLKNVNAGLLNGGLRLAGTLERCLGKK